MEKITEILEKHVQWIVLGLAVLFLGYMAYSYVLEQPITAQINGKTLVPGEINAETFNGPVKRLTTDMEKPAPPIPVNDFVSRFRSKMGFSGPEYASAFGPLRHEIWPGAGKVSSAPVGGPPVAGDVGAVATLPAPTQTLFTSGITVIKRPGVNPAPGAAPAAGLEGGGAGVQPVVATADLDWVTVAATIDAEQLKAAWIKAYGNPADPNNLFAQSLSTTRFLRVDMERQEMLPNGAWGPATPVPPLKMYKFKPMPPPDAPEADRLQYLDWASKMEGPLAMPAFYEWAGRGKPWWLPGTPEPALVAPAAVGGPEGAMPLPFDPANPPKNRRLTPEELKQVKEYQKMMKEQNRRPRPGKNTRPPLEGGVRVPRPVAGPDAVVSLASMTTTTPRTAPVRLLNFNAARDRAPVLLAQVPDLDGGRNIRNPYDFSDGLGGAEGGPMFRPGGPGPAAAGGPGGFNVFAATAPLQVWAHDENVLPGKSYRYRIRYTLYNPAHGMKEAVNVPKVAETLYMTSPWGEWTDKVTIGEHVKLWLAGNPNSREAKFDVFVWQDGGWMTRQERATPGDTIGNTPWMLVDLRANSRGGGYHVILLNGQSGATERREPRRDQEDPARRQLTEEAAAAAPAAMAR
jgi:hypothetical protein